MVETAGYSSASSSSVNDHRPQSWPLLSFLVHAGLFCCFHILLFPNSDMDYKIFNMSVIFLHAYKHGGPRFISLIQRTFVESAQNFDSGEISGWAQSLARNSHPFTRQPRLTVLSLACSRSVPVSLLIQYYDRP